MKNLVIRKIGPIHPALIEPIKFKVSYDENSGRIGDFNIERGFNYRAIEKLVEKRGVIESSFLIERICGICSHTHTTAYCQAIETIAKLEVPERARYIRVIVAELERITSHMLSISEIIHLTGADYFFLAMLKKREDVMNILELISGNRVHYGINTVGGVAMNINKKISKRVLTRMEELKLFIDRYKDKLDSRAIHEKMNGKGYLSKNDAKNLSVSGPTARGSNLPVDIRKNTPYAAYDEIDFEVKLHDKGDVWARNFVRFEELYESIYIIKRALEVMPTGPITAGEFEVSSGLTVSQTEAPRGENIYCVQIDEFGRLRVQIRTPTLVNFQSLRTMLLDENISDLHLIVASIDPCVSCADR